MSLRSFFSRRKPIPPEDVDLLLSHLLEPDEAFAEKFMSLVGQPNRDAFISKLLVYRLALGMVCMLSREREDSRFIAARKRFEDKVIFPLSRDNEQFPPLYFAAMREIAALESSESSHLSWAREWFAGIGVELTNFVDAGLFVIMWQQRLFHMLKLLSDIGNSY